MRPWKRALSALCFALLVFVRPDVEATPQQTAPQPLVSENASVDEMLVVADKLLAELKGFTAFPIYERALERAIQMSLELQEARARYGMARVLYYRPQYQAAREQALLAAEIFERLGTPVDIGRVNNFLSATEELLGLSADARVHAGRAVAAYETSDDPAGRARATLQFLRVTPMDLDAERRWSGKAAADARAAGDVALEGAILHGLGDQLFTGNHFEEALDVLLQAESLLLGTTDVGELGTIYTSIGRVYRAHGRFDEALRFQLKALALHEKGGSAFEHMQSLNAVATAYERLNDSKNAATYYERALGMAEESSSPRIQDFIRANLSARLIADGQFARAARELEQVLARGLDAYPSRRQKLLSLAYSKMDRPRDALDAATKAVDLCAKDEASCVEAFGRRAAVHAALGNTESALADLNAALAFIEGLRNRLVPSDLFKQDFNHAQQYIYSQAIALQVQEKQERQALETAELARARAFVDLLASRNVPVKERDRPLIAALQKEGLVISTRFDSPRTTAAPAPALTLRGERVPASPVLTARELELRSFAIATPAASADLVAIAARLRSTLVVYWMGEDELFVWAVLLDGTVHVRRVPVRESHLLDLIRETAPFAEKTPPGSAPAIVTRGDSTVPVRTAKPVAWRALYDLLIQPIQGVLPKARGSLLTIVPQGPLLNVSFAALQNAQGRYLLEDYAVHYAPAGAVLQFTAPKKRADARTGPMLVVADPALPKLSNLDRALPRLPGARGEAARIAQLIPANRLTLLQDGAATEVRARDAASGKAVVHFATHAIVRDDDPFGSFLALGPSASSGGDGLLTSQEVYGLDLNADLVVLSACRSGGGTLNGDGVSAFARAFIYAGTASLVASVWDVADEPTNRLLPDFYRSWLGGQSKSGALRTAQLRLLRDLRAGRVRITTPAGEVAIPEHPVFWAGFALFGEPD